MPNKFSKPTSRTKGQQQERLAESYLKQQGLRLVTRNYQCKMGEIDLIMQHGDTLVFVEVRYRKTNQFGSASETVDYRKQKKLMNTAMLYLQQHASYNNSPCRFDVIAINGEGTVEWIANAFGV